MPAVESPIDSGQEDAFQNVFAIMAFAMQACDVSLHGFASWAFG
jgi:hypothetical protein